MVSETDFTKPSAFYFAIPQGQHFHLEFPAFLDAETGEVFDFTTDPAGTWEARVDVTTAQGSVVAEFATTGENGVITLGDDGVVRLDLADEYTAALTATAGIGGGSSAALFADLVLTDPLDGEDWLWFKGKGYVTERVTA